VKRSSRNEYNLISNMAEGRILCIVSMLSHVPAALSLKEDILDRVWVGSRSLDFR